MKPEFMYAVKLNTVGGLKRFFISLSYTPKMLDLMSQQNFRKLSSFVKIIAIKQSPFSEVRLSAE